MCESLRFPEESKIAPLKPNRHFIFSPLQSMRRFSFPERNSRLARPKPRDGKCGVMRGPSWLMREDLTRLMKERLRFADRGGGNVLVRRGRECDGEGYRFSPESTYDVGEMSTSIFRRCSSRESGIINMLGVRPGSFNHAASISVRVKSSPLGVVEKPGHGSERVPLVLHGHRIDLTLSSRRRSNATEKRAFVSKGAPLRRAPRCPRLSLDTARERAYSG